jgi:hypothetical protein
MPLPRLAFASLLPAALLAPGPQDFATESTMLDARIEHMTAIGDALHRLHGAWAERLATQAEADPCADPAAARLVARSRAFGVAYRDAVQAARAELRRVEWLLAAPTIAPLLDDADREHAGAARATVDRHARMAEEDAAWHGRFVEGSARCELALQPAAGIGYGGPVARGAPAPVAIFALGDGLLCTPAPTEPGAAVDGALVEVEAGDRVHVIDGPACYGERACDCVPETLLPGAVLGVSSTAMAPTP